MNAHQVSFPNKCSFPQVTKLSTNAGSGIFFLHFVCMVLKSTVYVVRNVRVVMLLIDINKSINNFQCSIDMTTVCKTKLVGLADS